MFGYKFKKNTSENFQRWRKDSKRSSSQGKAWAVASNTPFRKYKKWAHEGGIRTPLIAHWPERLGGEAGGLVRTPGHVVDIMATCLDVAGADYPEMYEGRSIRDLRGRSLLPLLEGGSREGHERIYWEHIGHAAVREGRWKLVTANARRAEQWELYDLQADPTELNDLADRHPDRVERMKRAFRRWAKETNVLPWPNKR